MRRSDERERNALAASITRRERFANDTSDLMGFGMCAVMNNAVNAGFLDPLAGLVLIGHSYCPIGLVPLAAPMLSVVQGYA
jgi:hypothetical protein